MIQKNTTYMTFTASTKQEAARQRFEQRFGYPPEQAVIYKRLLWVGPVVNKGELCQQLKLSI